MLKEDIEDYLKISQENINKVESTEDEEARYSPYMSDFLGVVRYDAITIEISIKNEEDYINGLIVKLNEKSLVIAQTCEYDKGDDENSTSDIRYATDFALIDYEDINSITYAL